ncbi:MAG: ATP-binding cassette domain-containing protein [Desulfurococcaceae archaeon TW002]
MRAVYVNNLIVRVGGKKILGPLSFHIGAGELWLVCGDCGTGKTTLAKVLAGLIPELYKGYKIEGEIDVFGYNSSKALRLGITTYVPQDISLATLTTSAAEELFVYGLEHKIPELKQIVGGLTFRELSTLSAGEKYRVFVGLSTLLGKKLLIIDEPSGYLDPDSLHKSLEILKKYALETSSTVIVIAHRQSYYAEAIDGVINLGHKTECRSVEIKEGIQEGTLLEAQNLAFNYADRKLFEGISFRLERGDVMAVLGPNGSGKTTLLKILLGLLKPKGGSVKRYFRKAFYVPQLSSYWFGDKIDSLLKAQNCFRDVVSLANVSSVHPTTISLGEARRLSMYVGIYGSSDFVVVDEVSLGLDETSLRCFKELLRIAKASGKSVVFSTHDAVIAEFLEPDMVVEVS